MSKKEARAKDASNSNLLSHIKLDLKAKNESQKKFIKSIKENEITICVGPPGTGKTYVAAAESLRLLKNDGIYKKIVLIKSVTSLKDEEIGYLKGDLEEKMAPYMYSFIYNFSKFIGKMETEALKNSDMIEVLPIAFIRGINLDDSLIIVDESQNISIDNMLTIMTRIGSNSKMIILGDTFQIDLKNKKISSLEKIAKIFNGVPGIGIVEFSEADQVRNPLITIIEEKFKLIKGESSGV